MGMPSIAMVYKIGLGPSSSHTMGPANAAHWIKKHFPKAHKYKVILYGSLALTGKGHFTDVAIKSVLGNDVEIVFDIKTKKLPHPNTMDFIVIEHNDLVIKKRIFSIGGGVIQFEGEKVEEVNGPIIYYVQHATTILEYCHNHHLSLIDFIKKHEATKFWDKLNHVWETMQKSIELGLSATDVLPGKLKLERSAPKLILNKKKAHKNNYHIDNIDLMAYAYAVGETNASCKTVVTAPTCGAAGVLPAVLFYAFKKHRINTQQILNALAIAGLIANITRTNATIAGAEGGCQAEIGVACSMASAAYTYLLGGTNEQIFTAASIGMQHCIGLTCDPVLGYVQIPCIERNAVYACRAIDSANLAMSLTTKRLFNFDDDLDNMHDVGKSMKAKYRETSKGGLSRIYNHKIKTKAKVTSFDCK